MAVQSVAIVGAGFMGTGIAETAAAAGLRVCIYEPDAGRLARSRERLQRRLADDVLERITHTTELADLAGSDIAIEAATEDEQIKNEVFRELDAVTSPSTILASNTSSIPIANLAAATRHPERVLGLHFFSPVPVMKLVEVIAGCDTDADVVDDVEAFARQIGKHPIRSPDRAGFLVNSLLVPYLVAAVRYYEEGFATREDIDAGMKLGCGHPMGPLTLCDFIGLDVVDAICASLYDEFKRDEYACPPMLRRLVAAGHLGRKSGRGFYDYAPVREAVAV